MRYLYFDTETTGLPSAWTAHPKMWPHIVQIAWILTNSDGRIFEQANFITKNHGEISQPRALETHGITESQREKSGLPIEDVITQFGKAWRQCDAMVCHNADFDIPIVMGECYRAFGKMPFTSKPHICTMKQTTNIVKAPAKNGKTGYKWPSLAELCEFCGIENAKAHDAMGDVMATWECHQTLIAKGIILHGNTVHKL